MIDVGENLKEICLAVIGFLTGVASGYFGYRLATTIKNRRNNHLDGKRNGA